MHALLGWATAHPEWAGVAVFLVSLAESLAVIGILVPGVAMMFVAGAMVGNGALSFWPVCLWAIAGAIAGDGLSFWLGAHYQQKIHGLWPFKTRPELLAKGEGFFQRYGAYSIFLGRFFGPVRATIPVVAGMLGMPSKRFFFNNVLSALVWAPAYLLPGVVFGASLDLVSRVAGRLVILLVVVAAVIIIFVWVTGLMFRFLRPHLVQAIDQYFIWSSQHPLLVKISHPLLNPAQRDYFSLLLIALIFMVLGGLLGPWLVLDANLAYLRVSALDHLILSVNAIFSDIGCMFIALPVALLLYARSDLSALMHWLLVLLVALIAGGLADLIAVDQVVLRAVLLCGALAIFIADRDSPKRHGYFIYALASCFCALLLVAQLYLGTARLGALALTGALATLWLCFLGMAYHRHRSRPLPLTTAWRCISALVIAGSAIVLFHQEKTVPEQSELITRADWQDNKWRELAVYRDNWLGNQQQFLNVQWIGESNHIEAQLAQGGWVRPVGIGFKSLFSGLNNQVDSLRLPVLPKLLQSESETGIWLFPAAEGEKRFLILRLWATDNVEKSGGCPLWIGRVGWLQRQEFMSFWTFLDESADDPSALEAFTDYVAQSGLYSFQQRQTDQPEKVALVWDCSE